MTRQSLAGFIFINVIVSVLVALGIIFIFDETSDEPQTIVTRVVPIEVTGAGPPAEPGQLPADAFQRTIVALDATVEDQSDQIATQRSRLEAAGLADPTRTPRPNESSTDDSDVPALPDEILEGITLPASAGGSRGDTNPTPDNNSADTGSASVGDDGCQRYTVQQGDACSIIADRFDVTVAELLALNNEINANCTNLQVEQVILIPGETCQPPTPAPTDTPIPTATRTPFAIGTFAITNTPIPTAANAEVEITQILNFGDVTTEVVEIRNTGTGVVDLQGWRLENGRGLVYEFPDARLQPTAIIRIFSRVGQNTPGALYWNQTVNVWEENATATLLDADEQIQDVYTVSSETIEFGDTDE
jgi:LysM repeat protein